MKHLNPYCLALVLALAVQVGWAFFVAFAVSAYEESRRPELLVQVYERVQFDIAGEIVVSTQRTTARPQYSNHTTHKDLAGRTVNYGYLLDDYELTARLQGAEELTYRDSDWHIVTELYPPGLAADTSIFVQSNRDDHGGYFILYSLRDRVLTGYIGTQGYRQTPPPSEETFDFDPRRGYSMFAGSMLRHPELELIRVKLNEKAENVPVVSDVEPGFPFHPKQVVILSRGKVFLVDFKERTTTDLLPGVDDIVSIGRSSIIPEMFEWVDEPLTITRMLRPGIGESRAMDEGEVEEGDAPNGPGMRVPTMRVLRMTDKNHRESVALQVADRTKEKLLLVHPKTGNITPVNLPDGVQEHSLNLVAFAGGYGITQDVLEEQSDKTKRFLGDVRVWKIVGNEVVEDRTIALNRVDYGWRFSDGDEMCIFAAGAGSPGTAFPLIGLMAPAVQSRYIYEVSFADAAVELLSQTWPVLIGVLLVGLICAWLTDRHRQGCGLPRSWGWIAFAFLLGMPGYLGYMLHRRWPVKQLAPAPVPTGIEVYA